MTMRSFLFVAWGMWMLMLGGRASSQQIPVSACVTAGFSAGGPIVVGTIANTRIQDSSTAITLFVTDSLRGSLTPGQSVNVPVDWTGSPNGWVGRPPVWAGVRPEVGKHVLIMFLDSAGALLPKCVLDMDSADAKAIPVIKRMVDLENTPAAQKLTAMEKALVDPDIAVRNLAVNYLTSPKMRDPNARLQVLQHFAPIASNPNSPRRTEALGFIKRAYDGWSSASDVNYQILSFFADQLTDPDEEVRSIAVQYLHSKFFGGGKTVPDISRVRVSDPAGAARQLQKDVADQQPYAEQAARVRTLLNAK
jgi:hypothetical protein